MTVFRPRSLGRRDRGSAGLTGRSARSRRLSRNVTAVVGSCVLLASLSAVATGASGASTRTSDGLSGTITMNVSTCCSVQIIAQVSKAFRKLHPGVHFKIANVPNDQTYVPLLQTERLAGTEPMIDETYDVLTPTLEVDGLVGDLTSDLKAGNPYHQNYWYSGFLSSYIPPKGAPFGVGHVFALPAGADATVVMYNENEFKKAGVPLPKDGWTWKQMLADAAKLRIGHGTSQTQFGICLRPDWQALYNPILKAYGVASFTETKATLDTPAALAAWKLMISPLQNGDSVGEAAQQAKNGGLAANRSSSRVRQRCRWRCGRICPASSLRWGTSSSTTQSRCPLSPVRTARRSSRPVAAASVGRSPRTPCTTNSRWPS